MLYFWWGCRGNLKLITLLGSERVNRECGISFQTKVLNIWDRRFCQKNSLLALKSFLAKMASQDVGVTGNIFLGVQIYWYTGRVRIRHPFRAMCFSFPQFCSVSSHRISFHKLPAMEFVHGPGHRSVVCDKNDAYLSHRVVGKAAENCRISLPQCIENLMLAGTEDSCVSKLNRASVR